MFALLLLLRPLALAGPDPEALVRGMAPTWARTTRAVDMDRELGLPIQRVIWDDQGRLFEDPEYQHLRADVGLTDRVFDPSNPDYRF